MTAQEKRSFYAGFAFPSLRALLACIASLAECQAVKSGKIKLERRDVQGTPTLAAFSTGQTTREALDNHNWIQTRVAGWLDGWTARTPKARKPAQTQPVQPEQRREPLANRKLLAAQATA